MIRGAPWFGGPRAARVANRMQAIDPGTQLIEHLVQVVEDHLEARLGDSTAKG